jgi:lipopolysaccharide transport system ATP-binding protein
LTGRENVYLNGIILGMRKAEIKRKFDEIVAFAEVEQFIDTPVKRYSSGMRVRLAFAVAAHLEPEIVLLDEVLAVGDARFQKKCLQKMEDVGHQGRTVLFVSHNMPSISRICPRTLLLEEGRITRDGPSSQVIGAYLDSGSGTTAVREWPDRGRAPGNQSIRLRAVRVRGESGDILATADIRRPVGIDVEYDILRPGIVPLINVDFYNEEGVFAFGAQDTDAEWRQRPRAAGRYASTAWIPGNLLSEGRLFVYAGLCTLNPLVSVHYEHNAVAFHVVDTLDGDSARGDYPGAMPGVVRPMLKWSTRVVTDPTDD